MKTAAIFVLAAAAPAAAFAPSNNGRMATSISATFDRRDAINNIAKLVGGAIAIGANVDPAFAASNPALGGWRSKGKGGGDGTFVPGKGMREKHSFDELVSASNPALGGWRSKKKGGGDGTFQPGKGMRAHESFDELVAASNPALGGWRGKSKGGGDGTFVPGKGMRSRDFFSDLA
eukprot:g3602.t1.1.5e174189 g3602  g3602.t1 contig12:2402420-2403108(-)